MTVLLREAIGDRLRHARTNQRRTLRDISRAARVSLGYLSEVERGQKEASSELLASICEALELPLGELMHTVAADIAVLETVEALPQGTPARGSDATVRPETVPAVDGTRLVGDDLADLRSAGQRVTPAL